MFDVLVRLNDVRAMPVRAHPTDAGADLFSMDSLDIYSGETKLVDTGVGMCISVHKKKMNTLYITRLEKLF